MTFAVPMGSCASYLSTAQSMIQCLIKAADPYDDTYVSWQCASTNKKKDISIFRSDIDSNGSFHFQAQSSVDATVNQIMHALQTADDDAFGLMMQALYPGDFLNAKRLHQILSPTSDHPYRSVELKWLAFKPSNKVYHRMNSVKQLPSATETSHSSSFRGFMSSHSSHSSFSLSKAMDAIVLYYSDHIHCPISGEHVGFYLFQSIPEENARMQNPLEYQRHAKTLSGWVFIQDQPQKSPSLEPTKVFWVSFKHEFSPSVPSSSLPLDPVLLRLKPWLKTQIEKTIVRMCRYIECHIDAENDEEARTNDRQSSGLTRQQQHSVGSLESHCHLCSRAFHLFRRHRYHCYRCRQVICNDCSIFLRKYSSFSFKSVLRLCVECKTHQQESLSQQQFQSLVEAKKRKVSLKRDEILALLEQRFKLCEEAVHVTQAREIKAAEEEVWNQPLMTDQHPEDSFADPEQSRAMDHPVNEPDVTHCEKRSHQKDSFEIDVSFPKQTGEDIIQHLHETNIQDLPVEVGPSLSACDDEMQTKILLFNEEASHDGSENSDGHESNQNEECPMKWYPILLPPESDNDQVPINIRSGTTMHVGSSHGAGSFGEPNMDRDCQKKIWRSQLPMFIR